MTHADINPRCICEWAELPSIRSVALFRRDKLCPVHGDAAIRKISASIPRTPMHEDQLARIAADARDMELVEAARMSDEEDFGL